MNGRDGQQAQRSNGRERPDRLPTLTREDAARPECQSVRQGAAEIVTFLTRLSGSYLWSSLQP
jgi:hypothetical protein